MNNIKSCKPIQIDRSKIIEKINSSNESLHCTYCHKKFAYKSSVVRHLNICAAKKQYDQNILLEIQQTDQANEESDKTKQLELEIQLQNAKNKEIILHKYDGKEIPESVLQLCNIERTLALMKRKLYKMEVKMKTLNSDISVIEKTLEIKKQEIVKPVSPTIEPVSPMRNIEDTMEIIKSVSETLLHVEEIESSIEEKLTPPIEEIKPPSIDGCVYLLREREFISLDQPVYKIGRAKNVSIRFDAYPKGSEVLFTLAVQNMRETEKDIKDEFNKKFNNRKDIGTEYFEGSVDEMLITLKSIIS
jgi:hypothetical protein